MNDALDRPFTSVAQRLWLLERWLTSSASGAAQPFLSAITILSHNRLRVCFVRSACAEGVEDRCVRSPSARLRIERDARAFDSLDDAIAWADAAKAAWLCSGWAEVAADANDI